MSVADDNSSPTKLSDSQFEECMGIALHYLKSNPFIRNRDIRAVASISYDQAIYFFNRAIAEKRLTREGSGSGTRYVLPTGKEKGR
ncbi:MAG: putative HTH transcriptional regulator [Candidatus Binatia bacterium]|jgi:predicted HTH transcriptional regulator